jgi:hypothetical protein
LRRFSVMTEEFSPTVIAREPEATAAISAESATP